MKGEVEWFTDSKGYGFIIGEDGKRYFCHYQDIVGSGYRTLQQHQQVEFEPDQNAKGPRARSIHTAVRVENGI